MKKIVIINGHPHLDSLNFGLAEAYKKGAEQAGNEVKEITVANLRFEPNLKYGYTKRMDLEPDLLDAWEKIQWADHQVWVHPVWWGGMPALLKGFIDRLFLPGMAFRYRENSVWWDKLLKGKSAQILTTLDQPGWYYHLVYGRPSINQLKKSTLGFCGVKTTGVHYFGIVRGASENQTKKWVSDSFQLGLKSS